VGEAVSEKITRRTFASPQRKGCEPVEENMYLILAFIFGVLSGVFVPDPYCYFFSASIGVVFGFLETKNRSKS
jgi:hypothetical protein